jgi:anti-sigma regulatory factor (Ser/Thr protein kinase)
VFQVQDEGSGLPPQGRCSDLPDAPDACSGRGLFLIHQCFEDVRWSRRGNRVQVAVRRAA